MYIGVLRKTGLAGAGWSSAHLFDLFICLCTYMHINTYCVCVCVCVCVSVCVRVGFM